ncbi:MAG: VCBS repeat-containing protein, partial [Chryseolinea sp.]
MRRFLQLLPFLWISFSAIAQESNCGNGIDDDGDGFIDCFDGDCATNPSCKDFYVGRDKQCQVPPSGVAQFSMKVGTTSANRTTYTSGRLDVGDLDADGIPEVITLHPDDKKLYILDGRDLSIKATGSITATAEYFDHAIGNINGDNCSEIFIAEVDNGIYYISCYDCKGNLIWRKAIYGEPITMGLADFGGDGKVELYYRNEILDAATGTRLVKGSGVWNAIDAGPVAVDMLDVSATCTKCAGLELVLGGAIYSVDLGARTADAGVLALMKSIPAAAKYYPKNSTFGYVTSLTSVADYTLDGSLDVVMSGATNATNGTTSVFLWDVKNNTYKIFQPPNNWQHGTGRINIADIDGDGKPNAT